MGKKNKKERKSLLKVILGSKEATKQTKMN